jgi:hypothetical protein
MENADRAYLRRWNSDGLTNRVASAPSRSRFQKSGAKRRRTTWRARTVPQIITSPLNHQIGKQGKFSRVERGSIVRASSQSSSAIVFCLLLTACSASSQTAPPVESLLANSNFVSMPDGLPPVAHHTHAEKCFSYGGAWKIPALKSPSNAISGTVGYIANDGCSREGTAIYLESLDTSPCGAVPEVLFFTDGYKPLGQWTNYGTSTVTVNSRYLKAGQSYDIRWIDQHGALLGSQAGVIASRNAITFQTLFEDNFFMNGYVQLDIC